MAKKTRADIVTEIVNRTAAAWMELRRYEYHNMPICSSQDDEIAWNQSDDGMRCRREVWYALDTLMKSVATDAEQHTSHSIDVHDATVELSTQVWRRNRDARLAAEAAAAAAAKATPDPDAK